MSFHRDLDLLGDWCRKRARTLTTLREMCEDGVHAASYEGDRTSGHDTVLFCWTHQQDPGECQKAGDLCDGETIPVATDITGETTIRPDRPRRLLAELDQAEARIIQAASRIYTTVPGTIAQARQILAVYHHDPKRKLPDLERTVRTQVDHLARISAELWCPTCPRPVAHPCKTHTTRTERDLQTERDSLGKVDPDHTCSFCGNGPGCTKNPTTVNGNLPHPRTVCRSCYDRIRRTGRPPTRHDLDHLALKGKWPKIKEPA